VIERRFRYRDRNRGNSCSRNGLHGAEKGRSGREVGILLVPGGSGDDLGHTPLVTILPVRRIRDVFRSEAGGYGARASVAPHNVIVAYSKMSYNGKTERWR